MKKKTTSDRLKQIMRDRDLKQIDIIRKCAPICEQYKVRLGKNDLSQYVSGKVEPGSDKLGVLGLALNVSEAWLMGYDVPISRDSTAHAKDDYCVPPTVTEDVVEFPVIGEVAAGYEHIAAEDWTGETVSIPTSYLHGRKREEYFVLTVCGDSMYPLYMDGDKVLILKQDTLDRSGDIGVIRYDGEKASLKKVEYVPGEDWLRMVPINPSYKPQEIRGADLEKCSVIGIPKLLLRDIKQ